MTKATSSQATTDWDAVLDADLLTMDEQKASLGYLPEDFIAIIFLQKNGDFCLSRNAAGVMRLSVKAEDSSVHHMLIDRIENSQYCVRGMVLGAAPTVGELIYNLREPTFDIVSGILNTPIRFSRLVTNDMLKDKRIINEKKISSCRLTHRDYEYEYYRANVDTGSATNEYILKKSRKHGEQEWRQMMFEELRIAIVLENLKLPVRYPIAAVLSDTGYLVYPVVSGVGFAEFLETSIPKMDIATKIIVCRGVSTVMADLHMADFFHGALMPDNFFVKFRRDQTTNVRILFSSGVGLIIKGNRKHVTSADFSVLAPEVALTRTLTPPTGVYSLGRLFKNIMEAGVNKGTDANITQLNSMNALVKSCMSKNPGDRPSMDGVFMNVKSICQSIVPTGESEKWKINRYTF